MISGGNMHCAQTVPMGIGTSGSGCLLRVGDKVCVRKGRICQGWTDPVVLPVPAKRSGI
ncbi:hypothetical protein AA100600_1119 [Gluconobacter thailandicus F149-1 = NBRC 100600]|nr:hypothetical protein AA100600_1119 [Gluconobacter thailandicus F149-1 = NBRC 100600]